MLVINKPIIPLYGIIVVLSVFIGCLYIYLNMNKHIKNKGHILLYFMLYISFAFVFGILYSSFVNIGTPGFTLGLSAYGGLLGTIIASIVFEFILPSNKQIIKYTIISLPLVYGLAKIACFVSGCCYGLPYEGFLSVVYPDGLNIPLFPVQLLEVVLSLILFVIINIFKDKKNISYICLIFVSIIKFSTDFLRYDHLTTKITSNQIFSIILIIVVIVLFIINNRRLTYGKKQKRI